ncbi:MAG: PstS family phosphate ABC transporter substrate-binding protein [Vicinamibacteria bacterium]|nr:PstS family phosphate ABC transporter substrate-binding protein [Vicinamibacteria bacterium]
MKNTSIFVAIVALAAPVTRAQTVKVDPTIPAYRKVSGVSGTITAVGSDTMNNMMALWGESFQKLYPSVRIQVEGKGSSTAPPALIAGTAQLGPMSRAMKATEVDQFEQKYGYKPTQLRTAYDALAVFVNKDNPIEKLSFKQLDAVFSRTRKRGGGDATTWGALGLTGDWASRPFSVYGRNSASGTYGFFKEHVMVNGDYKNTVKEQPGSASVVQGITEDRYGIGYSGIGYKTSGVKNVALASKDGDPFSSGSYEDVVTGKYPLARFLYIYINKSPGKALDPLVKEFARFLFSKEGQGIVVKDGYLPLSGEIVKQELAKLQ